MRGWGGQWSQAYTAGSRTPDAEYYGFPTHLTAHPEVRPGRSDRRGSALACKAEAQRPPRRPGSADLSLLHAPSARRQGALRQARALPGALRTRTDTDVLFYCTLKAYPAHLAQRGGPLEFVLPRSAVDSPIHTAEGFMAHMKDTDGLVIGMLAALVAYARADGSFRPMILRMSSQQVKLDADGEEPAASVEEEHIDLHMAGVALTNMPVFVELFGEQTDKERVCSYVEFMGWTLYAGNKSKIIILNE
ncbi:hypothetical protein T492DRAFT_99937 [Pavlovales sp. CCMP2436]|nr:hypothetical protein T492DRAFT_99937 [Pavlovales sp. CCMP2436]